MKMPKSQLHHFPISLGTKGVGQYHRGMTPLQRPRRRPRPFLRSLVEVCSILFLFYSNLLMGEFEGGNGRGKTLGFAIHDIFTVTNFTIALVCAAIGYTLFEFWRRKLM